MPLPSGELGREEWIENPTLGLFIHTTAGIGNIHIYIPTFGHPLAQIRFGKISTVSIDSPGAYNNVADVITQRF